MLKKKLITLTLIFALIAGHFSVFAEVEAPGAADSGNITENVEIVDEINDPQELNPEALEKETEEVINEREEMVVEEVINKSEEVANAESKIREGLDLYTLYESPVLFSNIKLLLDGEEIKDDQTITGKDLEKNENKITYKLNWAIDKEVTLVTGDFFEIKIPDVFNLGENTKDGVIQSVLDDSREEIGHYFVKDGKLFYKHTSKDLFDDVEGTFNIKLELEKQYTERKQEVEIKIPYEENIIIKIKLDEEKSEDASRHGKTNNVNKDVIEWKILVNRYSEELEDVKVIDRLHEDLKILEKEDKLDIEIYQLTYDIYGKETKRTKEAEVDKKIEFLEKENKLTVNLGDINNPYEIVIKTKYVGDIPLAGTKKPIEILNKATINEDTVDSTAKLEFRPAVKKNGTYNVATREIKWTVVFNQDERKLQNPSFEDVFDSKFMEMVGDASKIKVKVGENTNDPNVKIEIINRADNTSGFKFKYDGELNEKVVFEYTTKVKDEVVNLKEENLKNDIVFENEGKIGGKLKDFKDGYIEKHEFPVDYENQKIKWAIEINQSFQMMKNTTISDELEGIGHDFDKDSFQIYEVKKDQSKEKPTEYPADKYTLEFTENGKFVLKFKEDTNSNFILYIKSTFDPSKSKTNELSDKVVNKVELKFKNENGSYTGNAEADTKLTPESMNDGKKYGVYDAQTQKITWYIFTNANKLSRTTKVVDIIKGNQEFTNPFDLKYAKYNLVKNGEKNGEIDTETLENLDYEKVDEKILIGEIKIGNDGENVNKKLEFKVDNVDPDNKKIQSYVFKFETSLKGKTVYPSYENNATLTNDKNNTTEVNADVIIRHGGKIVNKSGQQIPGGTHFKWSLWVNQSQSLVENVKLTDEVDLKQSYVVDSFKVYATDVEKNGELKKTDLLEKDKDYTVVFNRDEDNGDESFSLELHPNGNKTIEKAYYVEYDVIYSREDGNSGELTIKNEVNLTGDRLEKDMKIKISEEKSETVESNGTVGAKNSEINLKKLGHKGTELHGVEFEFYLVVNGKMYLQKTAVTDKDGQINLKGMRSGNYIIRETKEIDGYIPLADQNVKIKSGKDNHINLENSLRNFTVKKITPNSVSPKNTEFEVYYSKDGKELDYVKLEKNLIVSDESGIVVYDNAGKGLLEGHYKLKEIRTNGELILNTEVLEFVLDREGNSNISNIEFRNYQGEVQLIKVDADTRAPLAEVQYDLYKLDVEGVKQFVSRELTDDKGVITVNNLSPGNYVFIETKARDGYVLDSKEHGFKVFKEHKGQPNTVVIEAENFINGQGSVELSKTNVNGDPLEGAVYELYTKAGVQKEGQFTTNEEGIIRIENLLDLGDYYFKEVKAPEGYLINDDIIEFNISLDNFKEKELVKVSHVNYQAEIHFRKVDEKGNPLGGVEFELINQDNLVVAKVSSKEDGTVIFTGVKPGVYKIKESKTQEGFIINTKEIEIEIKENYKGKYVVVLEDFVNYQGTVIINKVDEYKKTITKSPAIFNILDKDKKIIVKSLETVDGIIKLENLKPGLYYIEEIKAPEGFEKMEELIEFYIADEHEGAFEALNIEVINRTIELSLDDSKDPEEPSNGNPKLPSTGQSNLGLYASIMIVGLGFALKIYTKKED